MALKAGETFERKFEVCIVCVCEKFRINIIIYNINIKTFFFFFEILILYQSMISLELI